MADDQEYEFKPNYWELQILEHAEKGTTTVLGPDEDGAPPLVRSEFLERLLLSTEGDWDLHPSGLKIKVSSEIRANWVKYAELQRQLIELDKKDLKQNRDDLNNLRKEIEKKSPKISGNISLEHIVNEGQGFQIPRLILSGFYIPDQLIFDRSDFTSLNFSQCVFGSKVNLDHAHVGQSLVFEDCQFQDQLLLRGLVVGGNLEFTKSIFISDQSYQKHPTLLAANINVSGMLNLKHIISYGSIFFGFSRIDGAVQMSGAILRASNDGALSFASTHIEGGIFGRASENIPGLVSVGALILTKASLGSDIDLDGATLIAAPADGINGSDDYYALAARDLRLTGGLRFGKVESLDNQAFQSFGLVHLPGARIEGSINAEGGQFICNGALNFGDDDAQESHSTINLADSVIDGDARFEDSAIHGALNLDGVRVSGDVELDRAVLRAVGDQDYQELLTKQQNILDRRLLPPGARRKWRPVKAASTRETYLRHFELTSEELINDQRLTVQTCDLPFYEDCTWVEVADCRYRTPRRSYAIISQRNDQIYILNGESDPIHTANTDQPILLNEDCVGDYLDFFCGSLIGERSPGKKSRFLIVHTMDDLEWRRECSDATREALSRDIRPPQITKDKDHYYAIASVAFADQLFRGEFKILFDGMVEMINDEPYEIDGELVDDRRRLPFIGTFKADGSFTPLQSGRREHADDTREDTKIGVALSAERARIEGALKMRRFSWRPVEMPDLSNTSSKTIITADERATLKAAIKALRPHPIDHHPVEFGSSGTDRASLARIMEKLRHISRTDNDDELLFFPKGHMHLAQAHVGSLMDHPYRSWPLSSGRMNLNGLTYDRIAVQQGDLTDREFAMTRWSYRNIRRATGKSIYERRTAWLKHQYRTKHDLHSREFRPQPYEQLAKVLRTQGLKRDADKIGAIKRRLVRLAQAERFPAWLRGLSHLGRAWDRFVGWLYDLSSESGYGTARITSVYVVSLAAFYGIFTLGERSGAMHTVAENGEGPALTAGAIAGFTLDTFVPLVSFGYADKFELVGAWAVTQGLATLLGAVLTAVFVLTYTGITRGD